MFATNQLNSAASPGQPTVPVASPLEREGLVRLLRRRRGLRDPGLQTLRDRVGGIDQAVVLVASPCADREDEARPVAGADDRVRDTRGAVEEIPSLQRPLLPLDDERAFAGEHDEVLLR